MHGRHHRTQAPSGDARQGVVLCFLQVHYTTPPPVERGASVLDRLVRVDWLRARPLRRAKSSGAKRQSEAPLVPPCV